MQEFLPTGTTGEWSVTDFRDSLVMALDHDEDATQLKLYFYAVTVSGWLELREAVVGWLSRVEGRTACAYIGTDHALTDPTSLVRMQRDGVAVHLMCQYQGVFHPKVAWLEGPDSSSIWAGSNNLTRNGLLHNIEFAIAITSEAIPETLRRWAELVAMGSEVATEALLSSYATERAGFEDARARARNTTFTWSHKREPSEDQQARREVLPGDLVVEVMPRETGAGGTQLQLPIAAVADIFDLSGVGSSREIEVHATGSTGSQALSMTVYDNRTVRISIGELDYRDRPCVIVFHKEADSRFSFDIVPQSIFPDRYGSLLARCTHQTREGSRRWGIVQPQA